MAGMPQGSLLDLVLDLLYTCDLPQLENNKIATFANDTTISKIGKNNINKIYWKITDNYLPNTKVDKKLKNQLKPNLYM